MERWFSGVDDSKRYCFTTASRLRAALQEPKVLDILIEELNVPGKLPQLKKMPAREKLEAIEHEITARVKSKTSAWHGAHGLEMLAGEMWQSEIPAAVRKDLWYSVKKEAELLAPVAAAYREDGLAVYAEIPMGRTRADLVAHQPKALLGLIPERFVAVELKNDIAELKRGMDQMSTYLAYSHRTYLALTPALGADYLTWHATAKDVRRWDPDVLVDKVKGAGLGLLLVEKSAVAVLHEAPETPVKPDKLEEIKKQLIPKRAV